MQERLEIIIIIIIIIVLAVLAVLYFLKCLLKSKSANDEIRSNEDAKSIYIINQNKKEQISFKLNQIRDVQLEDFINYEVTLLYQTELNSQEILEKISQKYTKTLRRKTFNFTPLYNEYDIVLVDECIVELLDSLGAKDFELELNQPFLRFEFFIKYEAKVKARRDFDEFLNEHKLN